MFLLQILMQQVSCYFFAKNLKQKKDSVSLLTINLKICFILWIIMSFFHFTLLASLNGQIISWSLAFMCGFTLILCFLMRKRTHDFIVLIVLSITSIFGLTLQILEEDDVRYFYLASFIMGSFALCFAEKSSLLLVLIIILGLFSGVKMPQIFSLFGSSQEKNMNLIIYDLSSIKWYSVLLEAISLVICQLFANNILKKYKDIKQRLNTANDTIQDLIAKLNYNKDRVETLNTQLVQATKSQDLFVSCISHELRNPLNGMMGSIDLLEAEIKEVGLAKILRRCKACGETLSTQINNLLDMAKINSNKLEINEFPTKMSSFIANIWPPIQNKIELKGLKGCLMIDKNLPLWLDIDSQRFQQILENLLGNALKFTSQGSIRVILSWVRGEKKSMYYSLQSIPDSNDLKPDQFSTKESIFSGEDGLLDFDEGTKETSFPHLHLSRTSMSQLEDFIYLKPYQEIEHTIEEKLMNHIALEDGYLKVDVLDTGCGITTEAQQKVFEPFVQADASITRNYGGAGLGLFLVKKLVEKMTGNIKMNSLSGLGSSFQITIPIKKPIRTERSRFLSGCQRTSSEGTDREEILGRVLERPWSEAGLKKLPSYRGLIVDDDLLNQNLIRSFLNKLGFEADTANNGLEGLDKYRRNPERYLFVTMDIQMPVMDGMTSRDQIREFEKANGIKNVPIVFVTGNSSEDYKRECLKNESENSIYFFRKPFRFSDCKTCIEKIMSDIGSSL